MNGKPASRRHRLGIALGAVAVCAATLAPSALGVTRDVRRLCGFGPVSESFVTVRWEVSGSNVRAIRTTWTGNIAATQVVTDEARSGVLITGGRKIWNGTPHLSGSHAYLMPWSPASVTDVNVSLKIGGVTQCHVRVPNHN